MTSFLCGLQNRLGLSGFLLKPFRVEAALAAVSWPPPSCWREPSPPRLTR